MRITIRVLDNPDTVRGRLQRDGWEVDRAADGSLSVSHPFAESERNARLRLFQLGLLTSGSLRIEFPVGPVEKK